MEAKDANRVLGLLRGRLRGRLPKCELCGAESWGVAGGVLLRLSWPQPLVNGADAWQDDGRLLPTVACSCLQCGNVKYFNYLVLKQAQAPPSPAEQSIEALRNVGFAN